MINHYTKSKMELQKFYESHCNHTLKNHYLCLRQSVTGLDLNVLLNTHALIRILIFMNMNRLGIAANTSGGYGPGILCSNCYKIKFVRAVACAPSFTCAPRTKTGPSTTSKGDIVLNVPCKLYTTIISPHIRLAQSKPEIGSPAHRLIRGAWDAHDQLDISGRTQRHGHRSLKNDRAQ